MSDEVEGLTLDWRRLVDDIDEIIRTLEPAPPMRQLTVADLEHELDRLTTKVVCHPDRAEALRAAVAAADPSLPLVRVIEWPHMPDPNQAFVIKPPGLYEGTDTP